MSETIEEMYKGVFTEYENVTAAKGCNQYKHVPGCPDAGGESNLTKTENEKREGDHFDNIEGGMIDAVAHAIIHNQDVFSSGFGFSTTKKNTIPETKIFIPKEKLSHLRKEYQKSKLNPYRMAEIFVRYDGKRAWNEQYNPKYPSRKK